MIEFTCPHCGASHHLKNIRKRVFCSCGGVAHNPDWIGKPISLYGPGDAMAELIAELGVREKPACSCQSLQRKMNELGVEGCEKQRDWIVQQLEANAVKWSWLEKLQIAASNVTNPLALSLAFRGNVYHALLDIAIDRYRQETGT